MLKITLPLKSPYKFIELQNTVRIYEGYTVCYSPETRNPKWVLEKLTKEQLDGPGNRKHGNFHVDPTFFPWQRASLSDFRKSGYNRGHLAAAANHKGNVIAYKETYSLSNISPQVGEGFNLSIWQRVEEIARKIVRESCVTYIVTGPLFLPRKKGNGRREVCYPVIGDHLAVPTHFFKVVLAQQEKGLMKTWAVLMPNEPIKGTDVTPFEETVEKIEHLSGLVLRPELLQQKIDQTCFDKLNIFNQLIFQTRTLLKESDSQKMSVALWTAKIQEEVFWPCSTNKNAFFLVLKGVCKMRYDEKEEQFIEGDYCFLKKGCFLSSKEGAVILFLGDTASS